MANREMSEEQIRFYREAFTRFFDEDGKGFVSAKDFSTRMKAIMVAVIGSDSPHASAIEDIINEVEADSTSTIDLPKFLTLMATKFMVDPSLALLFPKFSDLDVDGDAKD